MIRDLIRDFWLPLLLAAAAFAAGLGLFGRGETVDNTVLIQRVHTTDTLYRTDTLRLRDAVVKYRTARDTLTLTDTIEVVTVLAKADSALAACTTTVARAEERVAQRDTLIRTAEPRRVRGFGEVLSTPDGRLSAAAGANVRLRADWSAVARVDSDRQFRAGFRKTF